jgi:hypothetical protein
MLARQLTDAVGRDGRRVRIGLVVQVRQQVDQAKVVAVDDLDTVVGAVAVGHLLRELRLVELGVVEADGAGVDASSSIFVGQLRHSGDDGAGIDATGQEGTQRHLGLQAQLDGLAQAAAQFLGGFFLADLGVQRELDVPVALRLAQRLAAFDEQAMARGQFLRVAVDGPGVRHIAQREISLDGARVDLLAQAAMGHQALQLGAEQQPAVLGQRVVQRLHAQAVAGHEKAVAAAVVNHEGEHAAQVVHAILAPVLPGAHDGFGIALGAEHVAVAAQFVHQLQVVVDLAVEHQRHRLVVVEDGLLAGRDVDDRQAAVAETHAGLDVQVAFVRPAVVLGLVHPVQALALGEALAAGVEQTGDAAHGLDLVQPFNGRDARAGPARGKADSYRA